MGLRRSLGTTLVAPCKDFKLYEHHGFAQEFGSCRAASLQYSTASEATGCHTQFSALILTISLLSVASGRFARGTVLVASLLFVQSRASLSGRRITHRCLSPSDGRHSMVEAPLSAMPLPFRWASTE